jgi:hypothetical protein
VQGRRSSETGLLSHSVVRVGAGGLWGAFASERGCWRRIMPATDMCPRYPRAVWAGYLSADLFKTYFQKPRRIFSLVLHAQRGARSLAITNLVGRIRHALLPPLSMAWTIPCESSGDSSRPQAAGSTVFFRAEEIRAGGCPDVPCGSAVSPSRASLGKVAYAHQRGGVRF